MNKWNKKLIAAAVLTAVAATPVYVSAQPGPGPGKGPGQLEGKKGMQTGKMVREVIYGSQLMTLEERQEHQKKMWSAKTTAERQAMRDENHKRMTERATQQKVKIDPAKSDVYWRNGISPGNRD